MEARLERELERLKRETGLGQGLRVEWSPDPGSAKRGEVRGGIIHVYDEDGEGALKTLRHEFIDHHVMRELVEPLVEYVNMQKRLIDGLIYERKERLVDRLSKLF